MFDRLRDVPEDLRAYTLVLGGQREPQEWSGLPVVDLGALPPHFRFESAAPELQTTGYAIRVLLGQRHALALVSELGSTVGEGLQVRAKLLAVGTPGSVESEGYGSTIRAIHTTDGRLSGFFGSVLQLLPPDESGQHPVDDYGQLRTNVVSGFRLLMPWDHNALAPEVYAMWETLDRFWRVNG